MIVAATFVWLFVDIARNAGWPWYAVLLFGACWLALGLVAVWAFMIQIFTHLDLQGISQLSLRGVIHLRWQDVCEVRERPKSLLILSDGNNRVTVALMAYSTPHAVQRWLRDRLEESAKR
jgi:hypothetical protein